MEQYCNKIIHNDKNKTYFTPIHAGASLKHNYNAVNDRQKATQLKNA